MRGYLVAWLLGLSLLASGSALAQAESAKAINFQFTDINGRTIRLSDFRGKWVLVNFWAPWCPLCWAEVPALNELNKRKDFVVIGIGLDYGPDENVVRDAASRHNLDFHAIVAGGARRNPDSPFRQVGPVDFYPTSYLYDPNGEIVMFIPGQVKLQNIQAFVAAWNKKNPGMATDPPTASGDVKEVDYSKPKPATPPQRARRTTTY
jgi:thiol-disulfide isomerase/thioredoxin